MPEVADALRLIQFVDIGFNLTDLQFQGHYNGRHQHDADLAAVLARAEAAGVTGFLCTGSCVKSSKEAIEKCRALNKQAGRNMAYVTVGIHPCSAKQFEGAATIQELRTLILDNLDIVRAFGEIGLDAQRENWCPLELQIHAFREQLKLAVELGLPLFLHNRDTTTLFVDIVTEVGREQVRKLGGVVHSFDGSYEESRQFLDLGFDIGINGCGLRTVESLEMLRTKGIPITRLHFETDAPWCLIKPTHPSDKLVIWTRDTPCAVKPIKHDPANLAESVKGRCEPMHIRQVAEVLYRLLSSEPHTLESFGYFCDQIRLNSISLFKFDKPYPPFPCRVFLARNA